MGWEKKAKCPEMIPLGLRLRSLRDEKGWSQGKLGEMLMPSAPTLAGVISSWERANKRPTADTLIKLADIFGVSVDFLLGRTDRRTNTPDTLDAIDALKGVLEIKFDEKYGHEGELVIDENLMQYWFDTQTAHTAASRLDIAPDVMNYIIAGIKDKYEFALTESNKNRHSFYRYNIHAIGLYDSRMELQIARFDEVYEKIDPKEGDIRVHK